MGLDLIRIGEFGWANEFGLTLPPLLSSMVYKLVIQFVVLLILNLDLFLKVMFLQVWYKLCLNDVIFLLSLVVILISAHQNLF